MATVFFSSQRRVMGERRREGNRRKSLNLWHLQNKIYEIPSDYIYSESFICVFAPDTFVLLSSEEDRAAFHPGLPLSVHLPSLASVGLTLVGSSQAWQHPDTVMWFMTRSESGEEMTTQIWPLQSYQPLIKKETTLRLIAVYSSKKNHEPFWHWELFVMGITLGGRTGRDSRNKTVHIFIKTEVDIPLC